jgi:putative membrane protein
MSQHAFTQKTIIAAAVICFAAASGAFAQGFGPYSKPKEAPKHASGLAKEDVDFMQNAALGGMLEVELGKLAQQKATQDAVKKFGARMGQDHAKSNEELKKLAAAKGVALPTVLDRKHVKVVDDLTKTSRFDHEYMEYMVKDHKADVKAFEKEVNLGKDADVKGFASKTLPTLQEHLKLAETTFSTIKAAKK